MTTEEWDRAENKRKYDAMSQSERDAIDRAYFKRMKDREQRIKQDEEYAGTSDCMANSGYWGTK